MQAWHMRPTFERTLPIAPTAWCGKGRRCRGSTAHHSNSKVALQVLGCLCSEGAWCLVYARCAPKRSAACCVYLGGLLLDRTLRNTCMHVCDACMAGCCNQESVRSSHDKDLSTSCSINVQHEGYDRHLTLSDEGKRLRKNSGKRSLAKTQEKDSAKTLWRGCGLRRVSSGCVLMEHTPFWWAYDTHP